MSVQSDDESAVGHTTFQRRFAPGVRDTNQTVSKQGFDGVFYQKAHDGKRPAILAFGGSGGGNSMLVPGKTLAEAGYPTLTIAYFHSRGLPKHLVKIPLECFAKALRWLRSQPGIDPHRIYVLGSSRGTKAAQLVAVHYPKLVHGVILAAPSNVVNEGLTGGLGLKSVRAGESAWSFRGHPIPFALDFGRPHPRRVPKSVIPVEKINGPMFLVCGGMDLVWPSCPYSRAIMGRLQSHHDDRYQHVLAAFPEAGHFVNGLVPYDPDTASETVGRAAGDHRFSNKFAHTRVWPKLIRFLRTTSGH
ncbi:MAG: acyl-CoA thioester hydrolase/BAAT C-terminal domain-containing protein [Nocardioidaceae bacterium]